MQTPNTGITNEHWAGFGKVVKHYATDILTFSFLALVAWFWFEHSIAGYFGASPRDEIMKVLKQNYQFEAEYMSQPKPGDDITDASIDTDAQRTAYLADELKTTDSSHCPDDFQKAFTARINSIYACAQALSRHPHIKPADESLISGFMRGLNGIAEDQNEYQAWLDLYETSRRARIEAGKEMLEVAGKYGVTHADVGQD